MSDPLLTGNRRLLKILWAVCNAVAMVLIILASRPLWAFHLKPGEVHASGPGDGLYFFLVILVPCAVLMLLNLALTIRALLIGGHPPRWARAWPFVLMVGAWSLLAFVLLQLIRVPEGVESLGS
jgi:hypothetical protein